jgi:hypothetical protein
VHNATIPA